MRARIGLVLVIAAVLVACGIRPFDPGSKIESVRILATRADKPYAKPGDTVTMDVLAYDARADKSRPMSISWLPAACPNPANDAYYGCYPYFAQFFRPGVDLTPILTKGTTFSFKVPDDLIASRGKTRGDVPYGLMVAFTFACAGHVEYAPSGAAPNALPFGCFDENHAALGPNDFVFAFSLVYVWNDRTNANPEIQQLTFGGAPVDPQQGIVVPHCTDSNQGRCATTPVDVVVPDSSQELDPGDVDASGNIRREQVWVDYYDSDGRIQSDALILFDPIQGRLPDNPDGYAPPLAAGEQMLWAVVHDNRGGVAWLAVPVHVE